MTLLKGKEFAAILGLSPSAITLWKKTISDFAACYENEKIHLERACQYLYKRAREAEDTANSDSSEIKKYWDSKKAEIQVKQLLGELVNKREYVETEIERFQLVKCRVLEIPERLGELLSLLPPQKKEVQNVCRSIIEEVKTTISSKSKDWIERIADTSDLLSDAPVDREGR